VLFALFLLQIQWDIFSITGANNLGGFCFGKSNLQDRK
jgi:hypothetical protein